MRRIAFALAALFALCLAPAAAANPTMDVGAAEDGGKVPVFADSVAEFRLAAAAGMGVVRITALWRPGLSAPEPSTVSLFQTTAGAAALTGIRLIVSVYPASNREVPLDAASQAQFASFAAGLAAAVPALDDFIIGNEPNLNFFWLPQYNLDGTSASPGAYVALLARTYDALKRVRPEINVIGGSVSPAGTDDPSGIRPSHSPGRFILGMGEAYRAMGRARPVMDEFAFHPYGQRSQTPPSAGNPSSTRIALADYDKLVAFLGQAFDGTPQPGSDLPIVYDEYGVQSVVPAEKQSLYTQQASPVASDAVSEDTQADYYRQALTIAFCQPNVVAFLFFHTVDETDLRRWQSGLYYADLTPKTSFGPVRDAVVLARRGALARCPGLAVPVTPLEIDFRTPAAVPAKSRSWRIRAGCKQDCVYIARLVKLPKGSTTLATRGALIGGKPATIALPKRRVAKGSYQLKLRLTTRLNPGEPLELESDPIQVG